MSARVLVLSIVAAALCAAAGACVDPVHQSEVDALGGEVPGVPQGEYHRAGQPCTVCHGPEGPAETQFSLAGTVFQGPDCRIGASNAEILMVDSLGNAPPGILETNCVGNFFLRQEIFAPAFPILAWVRQGTQLKKMQSHVSRETACNQCHKDPNSYDSPGHIYLFDVEPMTYPAVQCAVTPYVPTQGCTEPAGLLSPSSSASSTSSTSSSVNASPVESAAGETLNATPADPPTYIFTSTAEAAAAIKGSAPR